MTLSPSLHDRLIQERNFMWGILKPNGHMLMNGEPRAFPDPCDQPEDVQHRWDEIQTKLDEIDPQRQWSIKDVVSGAIVETKGFFIRVVECADEETPFGVIGHVVCWKNRDGRKLISHDQEGKIRRVVLLGEIKSITPPWDMQSLCK